MDIDADDKFIIENYKKFTYDEMAKKLGITRSVYDYKVRILRDKGLIEKKKENVKQKSNSALASFKELDNELKEGKKYNIKYTGRHRKNGGNRFTGTLLKKADRFYIFRSNSGYVECFLKVDFMTREYTIKEV